MRGIHIKYNKDNKRTGYSLKISFGSGRKSFDQFYFSFSKKKYFGIIYKFNVTQGDVVKCKINITYETGDHSCGKRRGKEEAREGTGGQRDTTRPKAESAAAGSVT